MIEQPVAYRGRVKYDKRTAEAYQRVDPRKNQIELRLVDRAFALVPKTLRVLDVPCGGGRVAVHLAQQGYPMSAADLSEAMIEIARQAAAAGGVECPVERQDIEKMTYADRHFGAVVCFRLFHHFPVPAIRERVVTELCRVADRFVVLSYFSPASVTSIKRKMTAALGGKRSQKHSTSLREIEGYFGRAGFRLVKNFARLPFVHTLHLAVFERGSKL